MGDVRPPKPVMLLVAAFSRHTSALQWALERLNSESDGVALSSERFEFVQTQYYQQDMGVELHKEFHLLTGLVDPVVLPSWKLRTNQWEQELAETGKYPEARPLNLDPGYLTEAKLVLATTKDRDHRMYLDQGIYGEVTLYFHRGQWQTRPWTYPDYQLPVCHDFLNRGRQCLREQLKKQAT